MAENPVPRYSLKFFSCFSLFFNFEFLFFIFYFYFYFYFLFFCHFYISGSFGKVFLVRDKASKTVHALKVLYVLRILANFYDNLFYDCFRSVEEQIIFLKFLFFIFLFFYFYFYYLFFMFYLFLDLFNLYFFDFIRLTIVPYFLVIFYMIYFTKIFLIIFIFCFLY